MVNVVPAGAYLCLILPAAFTQPGGHLLADLCTAYRVVDVEGEPAEAESRPDEDEEVHGPLHPLQVVLDALHALRLPALPAHAPAAPLMVQALVMTVAAVGRQLQSKKETYLLIPRMYKYNCCGLRCTI